MINDLNLHSPLIPQADAGVSSEMNLMNLIGQGSSVDEALNQEDILSLLSNEGESSFSDILNTQGIKAGEDQTSEISGLIQNLDKIDLNSSDIKKLTALLETLSSKDSKVDIAQLLKTSSATPELQSKISNLIELSSKNNKDNNFLKEITSLIVKDKSSPVTLTSLDDVIGNKNKINKMLGLSSEEILSSKKNLSSTETQTLKNSKSIILKNFSVDNPNIIKNNINNLNSVLSQDKQINKNEIEQVVSTDLTVDAESSDLVKLDSSTIIKTNKVNEATKSLDLNQVLSKTNTQNEVITKIQDYIIQSKVSNEPNVNLTFNHSDLGDVQLNVQKMSGDNLAVTITSNNAEAVKFFTENKSELLQTLTTSGLNISEMKLENSTSTNKDSSSHNQNFSESKQNPSGSKQGEQDRESKRREELWELFDKEIA